MTITVIDKSKVTIYFNNDEIVTYHCHPSNVPSLHDKVVEYTLDNESGLIRHEVWSKDILTITIEDIVASEV